MLSKEKIEKEASKCAIGAGFYPRGVKSPDEREIGFNLGATWASEQYADFIKLAEEMINTAQNGSLVPRIVWETAKEELNKLKQP